MLQAAAWSADARFLLVSEAGESTIHAIRFGKEPPHIGSQLPFIRDHASGSRVIPLTRTHARSLGALQTRSTCDAKRWVRIR
jgi:hypothetical protein